ncbi:YqcC-like domain containing protein [Colwellia psychrerythraea]|uniref:YqcC-like domain containing protein n=2 Tax=Colwellia psychrerythraea TaxID=28229 RepID=A0A099L063_COLPS|nr:YqcC-like domain containing protein [Colwellia psychrerythraea]
MKTDIEAIVTLLEELANELKSLDLWQTQIPTTTELASSAPFCCDTLTFEQWLQFIFIPKIMQMIKLRQPLPTKIGLSPMAEQVYKHLVDNTKPLLNVIHKIDQVMTGQGN